MVMKMIGMRTMRRMTLALAAVLLGSLVLSGAALAQEPDYAPKESDVALDSPIRKILLDPSETRVDLDIDLFNYADSRRLVTMTLIDLPEAWDIAIWNAFFDFHISELVVEPTETTPGQRPRMRVRLPDPRPEPGNYSFTLLLTDTENPSIVYDRAKFTIGVPEGDVEDAGEITIRTDFAVLRGPSNSSYEFELVIKNDTGDQRSFNLAGLVVGEAQQPLQGWEVSFTPAFGEQKQISSLSILSAIDERINVNVRPPRFVDPGNYFIPVTVESDGGEFTTGTLLTLQVIGRGELLANTETGLLSMSATAGEGATNTLRLTNFGTGNISDIALDADTPPQWEVHFEVDAVENLPINNQIDVIVTITAPDDTIPGDYMVTLRGRSQDALGEVGIRVTVDQSTIWGWLGIVLVIIVVGGLLGVFWRLGRR